MLSEPAPRPGLRERKKARTRAAIQAEAMRLFQKQGYYETTIEQIADAAEVSPSTFFRYFPTKEDVVVTDDFDPILVEAFRGQAAELTPLEALRQALRDAFAQIPAEELDAMRERSELMFSVPELRARALSNFTDTQALLAGILAERAGRQPDDFNVQAMAGAFLGVMVAAVFDWLRHPGQSLQSRVDKGFELLEAGLPL